MPIIPNVRWGDERTYAFAFEGLAQGGSVAVSTNGTLRNKRDRAYFAQGLACMVAVLRPRTIVNYSQTPEDIFGPYRTSDRDYRPAALRAGCAQRGCVMGGGSGAGLFSGTYGAREADPLGGGTLIAAAAKAGTASDAGGGNSKDAKKNSATNWYDSGLPLWMFPYGHPEHDRRMETLERTKSYLEGYASAHDNWGILEGKSWFLKKIIELFGESQRKKKKQESNSK